MQINTIPLQDGLDQQHFSKVYLRLKNQYLETRKILV